MTDDEHLYREAFNLFLGEVVGRGQYRVVYLLPLNDEYVAKVDDGRSDTQAGRHNLWEWGNWWSYKDDPDVAPWLCPCHSISPDGRILIMKRAAPIRASEVPSELPAFVQDIKFANLGWLNGRIVVTDYAFIKAKCDVTMKAVDWDAKTFRKDE